MEGFYSFCDKLEKTTLKMGGCLGLAGAIDENVHTTGLLDGSLYGLTCLMETVKQELEEATRLAYQYCEAFNKEEHST